MKFILTSTGLPNGLIRDRFLEMLGCDPKTVKVAFIPTAADPEEDKWFVKAAIDEIKEIGMELLIVDLKEENQESLRKKLLDCSVIYVNGGSTKYLLDWTIKSDFDDVLKQMVNTNKIYVGSSAGSVLAGPTGINLVPFIIYPHFTETERIRLEGKIKSQSHPIIAVTDTQAVIIDKSEYKLVEN